MSFKKIIIIFFSLTLLVLFFWLAFEITKKDQLIENNVKQEGGEAVLEIEETLEIEEALEVEETLEVEDILREEVVVPIISTSTLPTSTIKKQMIVIEKED